MKWAGWSPATSPVAGLYITGSNGGVRQVRVDEAWGSGEEGSCRGAVQEGQDTSSGGSAEQAADPLRCG